MTKWQKLAVRYNPNAYVDWDTDGRYALVLKCRDVKIALHETLQDAEEQQALFRDSRCGGSCWIAIALCQGKQPDDNWHEVVDLQACVKPQRRRRLSVHLAETVALRALTESGYESVNRMLWSLLADIPYTRLGEIAKRLLSQGRVTRVGRLYMLPDSDEQ